MELDKIVEICETADVSSGDLLEQREKLDPEVFNCLNDNCIEAFYTQLATEVKTFKGHMILAIDGSDWRITNNSDARAYTQTLPNQLPRIKVSHLYDILNCYVLDSQVEPYKFSELILVNRHLEKASHLIGSYPYIKTMDRGDNSLADLYHSIQKDEKFVVRLKPSNFKVEQQKMTRDDQWIEIGYQYDRIRRYKDRDEELYQFYEAGHTLKVRFINLQFSTGEVETLMTNLDEREFSKDEIDFIYQLRWGMESHYHFLKKSMKGTYISSGKEHLIKQEIYSQRLGFNLLQAKQNKLKKEINQEEYNLKMKININMAIDYLKKYLIYIILEDDVNKRNELYETLHLKVLKNIVPVLRSYESKSKGSTMNKYSISKSISY